MQSCCWDVAACSIRFSARKSQKCVVDVTFCLAVWLLAEGEQAAHPKLMHVTECSKNEEAVQDKEASVLMDQEVSDELSFLVDQSISFSPSRTDSMPYIM